MSVIIIESKSVSEYLHQLEAIGEDVSEHQDLWGYSLGVTEEPMPVFEYPRHGYEATGEFTNFDLVSWGEQEPRLASVLVGIGKGGD